MILHNRVILVLEFNCGVGERDSNKAFTAVIMLAKEAR
jgi:hypothetical protein